jgi:hypothetical protein
MSTPSREQQFLELILVESLYDLVPDERGWDRHVPSILQFLGCIRIRFHISLREWDAVL